MDMLHPISPATTKSVRVPRSATSNAPPSTGAGLESTPARVGNTRRSAANARCSEEEVVLAILGVEDSLHRRGIGPKHLERTGDHIEIPIALGALQEDMTEQRRHHRHLAVDPDPCPRFERFDKLVRMKRLRACKEHIVPGMCAPRKRRCQPTDRSVSAGAITATSSPLAVSGSNIASPLHGPDAVPARAQRAPDP